MRGIFIALNPSDQRRGNPFREALPDQSIEVFRVNQLSLRCRNIGILVFNVSVGDFFI